MLIEKNKDKKEATKALVEMGVSEQKAFVIYSDVI